MVCPSTLFELSNEIKCTHLNGRGYCPSIELVLHSGLKNPNTSYNNYCSKWVLTNLNNARKKFCHNSLTICRTGGNWEQNQGEDPKSMSKSRQKDLNQLVRVGMLGFVCMLLMCLNGAEIYIICKFRLQSTENFFGENAVQICHQGQKAWQTATRVSKTNTYNK